MVKVKICGITRREEALFAAAAGADAVGFVLAESPRRVTPEQVRDICGALPPFVSRVGVFVDEEAEKMLETALFCGLDTLQVHGRTFGSLPGVRLKVIRAIAVRNAESLEEAARCAAEADAFLVDAYVRGKAGGTGKTFDWSLLKKMRRDKPLLLAGGLTEENMGRALEEVRPYGVDVSSGVERGGRKDPAKIHGFVQKVRRWEHDHEKS